MGANLSGYQQRTKILLNDLPVELADMDDPNPIEIEKKSYTEPIIELKENQQEIKDTIDQLKQLIVNAELSKNQLKNILKSNRSNISSLEQNIEEAEVKTYEKEDDSQSPSSKDIEMPGNKDDDSHNEEKQSHEEEESGNDTEKTANGEDIHGEEPSAGPDESHDAETPANGEEPGVVPDESDDNGEEPGDDVETTADGEEPGAGPDESDDAETPANGKEPSDDVETHANGEEPIDDVETPANGEELGARPDESHEDVKEPIDDVETHANGEEPSDDAETPANGEEPGARPDESHDEDNDEKPGTGQDESHDGDHSNDPEEPESSKDIETPVNEDDEKPGVGQDESHDGEEKPGNEPDEDNDESHDADHSNDGEKSGNDIETPANEEDHTNDQEKSHDGEQEPSIDSEETPANEEDHSDDQEKSHDGEEEHGIDSEETGNEQLSSKDVETPINAEEKRHEKTPSKKLKTYIKPINFITSLKYKEPIIEMEHSEQLKGDNILTPKTEEDQYHGDYLINIPTQSTLNQHNPELLNFTNKTSDLLNFTTNTTTPFLSKDPLLNYDELNMTNYNKNSSLNPNNHDLLKFSNGSSDLLNFTTNTTTPFLSKDPLLNYDEFNMVKFNKNSTLNQHNPELLNFTNKTSDLLNFTTNTTTPFLSKDPLLNYDEFNMTNYNKNSTLNPTNKKLLNY
jgi:hypothetical protein